MKTYIVFHGTDTPIYISRDLGFLLQNLQWYHRPPFWSTKCHIRKCANTKPMPKQKMLHNGQRMDFCQYYLFVDYYHRIWIIFYVWIFCEVNLHQRYGDQNRFYETGNIQVPINQDGTGTLSAIIWCVWHTKLFYETGNFVCFQAKFGKLGTEKHIRRDKQTVLWIQQGQRQLFCGIFIGEIYCMKLGKYILFGESKMRSMMDSAGGMDRFMA